MTLDGELKRTFDALAERLHAEVERQVRAAIAELPVRPQDGDSGKAQDADSGKASSTGAPGNSSALEAADTIVVDAIRLMDGSRSLTEILDALATGAAAAVGGATAVLLRRNGRWHPWRTTACGPEADPGTLAERATFPLLINGETIGVVYAEHGATTGLEILTRHASRCLESMTAFRAARALARPHDPARPAVEIDDEDGPARRYARLLVSEIKLYHQGEVAAGCRERDLGARLGGEIARARVLYEQRVPLQGRSGADYFHEELVRTLADGDASLLKTEV